MSKLGIFIDLTGKVFNRLTVIERIENRVTTGGNPKVMWHCLCECKNEIDVASQELRKNKTKSCGCYNIEMITKRMSDRQRKYNTYDLTGIYGIGYTTKSEEFYFDLEDYEKIKDYCWFIHHTGYVSAKVRGTEKHVMLHKVIMNCINNEFMVDHKDGIKHNCKKMNLRVANYSKNNENRDIGRNNTSGVVGVHWHSRDCVWETSIGVNNERIYLGRFTNFDDAVSVRKQAEEEYFGEWSFDNSREVI